jgi:hypothetical protein
MERPERGIEPVTSRVSTDENPTRLPRLENRIRLPLVSSKWTVSGPHGPCNVQMDRLKDANENFLHVFSGGSPGPRGPSWGHMGTWPETALMRFYPFKA